GSGSDGGDNDSNQQRRRRRTNSRATHGDPGRHGAGNYSQVEQVDDRAQKGNKCERRRDKHSESEKCREDGEQVPEASPRNWRQSIALSKQHLSGSGSGAPFDFAVSPARSRTGPIRAKASNGIRSQRANASKPHETSHIRTSRAFATQVRSTLGWAASDLERTNSEA